MHSLLSTSKRQHHVADIEHVLTFNRYQAADAPPVQEAGGRQYPVYLYATLSCFGFSSWNSTGSKIIR